MGVLNEKRCKIKYANEDNCGISGNNYKKYKTNPKKK